MRALTGVVALVVLPSMAPDVFGIACPHHGGEHHGSSGVREASSPEGTGSARHTESGEATDPGLGERTGSSHPAGSPAHTGSPAHHAPAPDPASTTHTGFPSGGAPPCTCAGECPLSGGTAVSVAVEREAEPVSVVVVRRVRQRPAPHVPAPPFFLPFATAPPRA